MNKQEQAASVAVIGSTSEAYARKEEVERCIFSADFMRFIMAQPSPDYWTPRPVPLVGACRYCGQTRPTAEAPAGSIKTQEDADEWASRTCNCEQGRRLANVWTARGRINALFADFSTDVRDMLVEIAELVQDEEIGATSTALDGARRILEMQNLQERERRFVHHENRHVYEARICIRRVKMCNARTNELFRRREPVRN